MLSRSLILILTWLFCTAATCQYKADVFTVGNGIIMGAHIAVSVADGVVTTWCQFSSPESCAKVREEYNKYRMDVMDGIDLAATGLQVAEDQHQNFDINKLMAQAEVAYQKLAKFLNDLGLPVSPGLKDMDGQKVFQERRAKLKKTLLRVSQ